jgi:ATP-dependent Clp protease adapter protein ClpS
MADTATVQTPVGTTETTSAHEGIYEVVLHNDDHNTMAHVVRCLMRVFGHTEPLAAKIMVEAHERGKAVAEVESETPARLHHDQLRSYGLTVTLERV